MRSGLNGLVFLSPRLAKLRSKIDESRGRNQSSRVDSCGLRWKVSIAGIDACKSSADNQQPTDSIQPAARIDQPCIFN
jgi:hypothetical protein